MKKSLLLLSIIVFLYSCKKEKAANTCEVEHMPYDYSNSNNTLIPVDTRNFWTYTDSIFNPGTGALEKVSTSLIKIQDVYQVNDLVYFDFTSLFAPMTVSGDTLFFVDPAYDVASGNCYSLKKAYFPFVDSIQYGASPDQIAYKSPTTIVTPAGSFSNNTVYKDGAAQELVFHDGVGLIKVSNYLANGILRRSLTLKDYSVY